MTEGIATSSLGRLARGLADGLSDRAIVEAALSRPDGDAEGEAVMSAVAQILTALDNSMSNREIDDVLGRGTGPMHALSERVAAIYGAERAVLTQQGSSQINVTMAMALRAVVGRDFRVLVDRGCHISVSGGLALAQVRDVVWLDQAYDEGIGLRKPLSPDELDRSLASAGPVDAIMLTMPSYDGFVVEDIARLRTVCDQHNCRLIVDSAWGAFHGLLQGGGFPPTIARHAHATTISLHKKGLACSGSSAALFNDEVLAHAFMRFCDLGLVSTSPPFLLFSVLEQGLDAWQSAPGQEMACRMVVESQQFAAALDKIPGLRVVRAQDLGPGLVADPSHILVDVRKTGLLGYEILEVLSGRYATDAEKATLTSLLFLFGPGHIENWPRIVDALLEIVSAGGRNARTINMPSPPAAPGQVVMPMHAALYAPLEKALPEEAIGRIAAQPVAAYPPGAAILQPGERITREAVDYLMAMQDAGSRLKGVAGPIRDVGLTVVADATTFTERAE